MPKNHLPISSDFALSGFQPFQAIVHNGYTDQGKNLLYGLHVSTFGTHHKVYTTPVVM